MLVNACEMVLFQIWVSSDPETWIPTPAPSTILEAIMFLEETTLKIATGTLTK